jgi:hypothetical protein
LNRLSKISWFVEPPTNHDILPEPSSIIVLSFKYKASFYLSFNISSPSLFLASA